MPLTKIENLINPEVMADMISAKIDKKIVVTPFAKVDDTLSGVPGDTIKVPQYAYIGDAIDVAEGAEVDTTTLTATVTDAKIKKAMKGVSLTDEAVLSGYGDPVAETNNQLAAAIASKVDEDAINALYTAQLRYDGSASKISYDGLADALDLFEEETNCKKVIFVHPTQMSALRKDKVNFIGADKIANNVIIKGEVGEMLNMRIVPSKRVRLNDETYVLVTAEPADWATKYTSYFTKDGSTYTAVAGNEAPEFAENTYYEKVAAGKFYINPIVKIEEDDETEDETPAITIYLKRDTNVESERHSSKRTTDITVDKFYTVALSNASKVVLAQFKK